MFEECPNPDATVLNLFESEPAAPEAVTPDVYAAMTRHPAFRGRAHLLPPVVEEPRVADLVDDGAAIAEVILFPVRDC